MMKSNDVKKELKNQIYERIKDYKYTKMKNEVKFTSKFGSDSSYLYLQITNHFDGKNIYSWVSFRYDNIENIITKYSGIKLEDGINIPTLRSEMHTFVGDDMKIYSISEFNEIKLCAMHISEFFINSVIPFINNISDMEFAFSIIKDNGNRNIVAGIGSIKAMRITTMAHVLGYKKYRDEIINEYISKFEIHDKQSLVEYKEYIGKLI